MADPKTEELQLDQVQRELSERRDAETAALDPETKTHARRADKHQYLREKLADRARSEEEGASEDSGG
jgi:hypothetical protein